MGTSPYLSIVATSRNDDHGGNTLYRTQIFVDSFLEQCERHQLPAELILVEWNPPADRKPLAEVIRWSKQNRFVDCRVITVPYERHIVIRYGRVLPLFQMIGKNVGIRRARGEYVLATNIDIMFSEELMSYLAKRRLQPDRVYRCDRFDVDSSISDSVPLDEKLDFAWKNLVRKNRRLAPPELVAMQNEEAPIERISEWMVKSGHFEIEEDDGVQMAVAKDAVPLHWLHMDACGDFTMLHRDGWNVIHGYPEIETFSLHLDSLGLQTAHWAGFRETAFLPPLVCFHIEHAVGSGYIKEHAESLYSRLRRQGIGWLDYEVVHLMFERMHNDRKAIDFNSDEWGMRDIQLEETSCLSDRLESNGIEKPANGLLLGPVTAVVPEFYSDEFVVDGYRRALEKEKGYVQSLNKARVELESGLGKIREAYQNSQRHLDELSAAHARALETIEDFRKKVTESRNRLSKYDRWLGWTRRFGLFR